jgi:integrase
VRKPVRPPKPYPDFPLTPHPAGHWQKKIRGRIYYFGKWGRRVNGKLERIAGDGWEEALKFYQQQRDDLFAGRTPRAKDGGLAVGTLCDHFRNAKLRRLQAGELGARTFQEYERIGWEVVRAFGVDRLVDDLAAGDFEALRARLASKWGPVRLAKSITLIRSVFKYGTDNGLIERAVRYGGEFRKPGKAVLRRHRAKNGERMLETEQLRTVTDGAMMPGGDDGPELVKPGTALRAMILLGLNCGFGNGDCATLPLSALDLTRGWINFPRPKTGIARRCPLWPETIEALRTAIAERPEPADNATRGLVFVNPRGLAWVRETPKSHTDLISVQFTRLLQRLKLYRGGMSFYILRRVFRTVADAARDPVAVDLIMGHADPSMGAVYRERVEDDRLRAVTNKVRDWLYGSN